QCFHQYLLGLFPERSGAKVLGEVVRSFRLPDQPAAKVNVAASLSIAVGKYASLRKQTKRIVSIRPLDESRTPMLRMQTAHRQRQRHACAALRMPDNDQRATLRVEDAPLQRRRHPVDGAGGWKTTCCHAGPSCKRALHQSTCAVISSRREPLLKRVPAAPTPQ